MSCNETERRPSPSVPGARPRRVVVIGFGSPIRGDDAVGPVVADRLEEQLASPQVEVLARHILTAELVEQLRAATLAIFLDASLEGVIGQVDQRPLVPDTRDAGPLAHALDAGGLLGWTQALYGQVPDAVLLTTRGQSFSYAPCQLSPAVEAVVPQMLARVQRLIREHLDADG